jgi:hypothetical protein
MTHRSRVAKYVSTLKYICFNYKYNTHYYTHYDLIYTYYTLNCTYLYICIGAFVFSHNPTQKLQELRWDHYTVGALLGSKSIVPNAQTEQRTRCG